MTWARMLLLICLLRLLILIFPSRRFSSLYAWWTHRISCLINRWLASSFIKQKRQEQCKPDSHNKYSFKETSCLLKNLIFLRSEVKRVSIFLLCFVWFLMLPLKTSFYLVCKFYKKTLFIILFSQSFIAQNAPCL